METISLNINGVCREPAVGKNWTLLKTLRDGLRLMGGQKDHRPEAVSLHRVRQYSGGYFTGCQSDGRKPEWGMNTL